MVRGMRPAYRSHVFIWVFALAGCGLFTQEADAPPEAPEEPPPAQPAPSPGPRHEVLAYYLGNHPTHSLSVLYPPPVPLSELPPETKPAGDDVVWVSGYWSWDTRRDDWVWVSGVWVHAPQGRHWVPGYWSVADDGWRWVPGSWAVDAPPRPPAPPPTLAYVPSAGYYNDLGYSFFTGYGFWWPVGYRFRSHHNGTHGSGHNALLPSGHAASIPVTLHGPQAVAALPSLLPPLASNIHNTPALPPHLNMASILASVPKPMTAEFAVHPELNPGHGIGSPALSLAHGDHNLPIFSKANLQTMFHEHPGIHEALVAHPGVGVHSGGGHSGGSHGSGGHGGGGHGGGGHGR